jgi:hypothetical protein
MTTILPVHITQGERSLSVGLSFYVLFAVCTMLLFPLHAPAHYFAYRIPSIHLHITLNTASPNDQSQRKPIAELAGPLLNLVVPSVAAMAYQNVRRQRRLWAAMALASAMIRLVIYVLVAVAAIATGSGLNLGNEEPIAAHIWGLPHFALV